MTCHVSISISSPWQETTTATCEARYEPRGGTAQNSAEQLRRLQEACLAAVSAAAIAAASPPRQSATQARPTLRQLARLYRVATRIISFDLRQLQSLSGRRGYLTELQRHADAVARDPAAWLPWAYREQLVPATV